MSWIEEHLASEKEWVEEGCKLGRVSSPTVEDWGSFDQRSLDCLRGEIQKSDPPFVRDPKPFLFRYRKEPGHLEYFDTSMLQAQGVRGAMYQVASNFNCLEVSGKRDNPFSGHFLTKMMKDVTQGPSAAGGCATGAIQRLYLHRHNPINLLESTSLVPENGKLADNNTIIDPGEIQGICVGLHTNAHARYTRDGGDVMDNPLGPNVDQVYTSTCRLPPGATGRSPLASHLLYAAYEGTYMSAVMRRSPRLVLTLVGGGTFHNPLVQIVDAMANAHKRWARYLPRDCQVVLPYFPVSEKEPPLVQTLRDRGVDVEVECIPQT